MNYERVVSTIEYLPPLSDTSLSIQSLYVSGAQNVNISELIRVIESDAVLSANILKMINSPLYGFSKKIVSITQAVTLFGTELIFGLVIRYSINSAVVANLRAYGRSNEVFNTVCHLQSNLLTEWYSKVNLRHARFLAPLALIMESGKLVLAKEITNAGSIKDFCQDLHKAESVSMHEHSIFKTTSYFVSGLLFEHWNFNPLYVAILKGLDYEHQNLEELKKFIDVLDVVRTAVNVKDILTSESISEAAEIVSEIELDVNHFMSSVEKVKNNIKEKNIL